jgi:hypothetical protein
LFHLWTLLALSLSLVLCVQVWVSCQAALPCLWQLEVQWRVARLVESVGYTNPSIHWTLSTPPSLHVRDILPYQHPIVDYFAPHVVLD